MSILSVILSFHENVFNAHTMSPDICTLILDKRPTAGERTDRMDGCRQHGGVNFRGHGTGCRRSQDRPGLLFRKIQR